MRSRPGGNSSGLTLLGGTAPIEVQALGAETLAVKMNVKDPADWTRCREAALAKFGDIASLKDAVRMGSTVSVLDFLHLGRYVLQFSMFFGR